MSNDPSGDRPAWPGQPPYPGAAGYGQQQPAETAAGYPGSYAPGYGQQPGSPYGAPQGQSPYGAPYGGPGYGAPAGVGPGGLAPPGPPRNFFGALFDFSFDSFATPVVIRALYVLVLIGIALGYVVAVIIGFTQGALTGLAFLVGGAVVAFVYLVLARITLELYYAVVRIAEDVRVLRDKP
jgi:hypothetical protein